MFTDRDFRALVAHFDQRFDRIEQYLRLLAGGESAILHKENTIMSLLDDAAVAEDAALAKVTANTNALSAIKDALDAQTAKIVDLTAQLAAAGNDPAKIQAVLDKANAIVAAADNQALAEAALTNTPADPNA